MGFLVVSQDVVTEKRRKYVQLGALYGYGIENDVQIIAGRVLRPSGRIRRQENQRVFLCGLPNVIGANGDPVALHL